MSDEVEIPDGVEYPDVPDWDDEYVDRVSDRIMFNYDLKKEYAVSGETFTLYGAMNIHSRKEFLHPALSYAHHDSMEHLFVRRANGISDERERGDGVSVADLEALVEFGHDLADEWVAADEQHYSTDFTFAVVVDAIHDDVRKFVRGFKDRTLLKFGYYGHYEINLLVVAPDAEEIVASRGADVRQAFATWEPIEREKPGLLGLIARRLQM